MDDKVGIDRAHHDGVFAVLYLPFGVFSRPRQLIVISVLGLAYYGEFCLRQCFLEQGVIPSEDCRAPLPYLSAIYMLTDILLIKDGCLAWVATIKCTQVAFDDIQLWSWF